MTFFHHVAPGISIPIPDKDILAMLKELPKENAFQKRMREAKVIDGGKKIRCPLEYKA